MTTIQPLVTEFLAQKRIAVAGVSETRNTPANLIYRTLKSKGYEVYGVSPSGGSLGGDTIFRDFGSIPAIIDGVVIVTRPALSEEIMRQCVATGIRRVWMHDMMGTRPRIGKGLSARVGSVSKEAARIGRENGITVIAGSCPMQFIGDFGHKCVGSVLRVIGALEV